MSARHDEGRQSLGKAAGTEALLAYQLFTVQKEIYIFFGKSIYLFIHSLESKCVLKQVFHLHWNVV